MLYSPGNLSRNPFGNMGAYGSEQDRLRALYPDGGNQQFSDNIPGSVTQGQMSAYYGGQQNPLAVVMQNLAQAYQQPQAPMQVTPSITPRPLYSPQATALQSARASADAFTDPYELARQQRGRGIASSSPIFGSQRAPALAESLVQQMFARPMAQQADALANERFLLPQEAARSQESLALAQNAAGLSDINNHYRQQQMGNVLNMLLSMLG